MMVEVAIVSGVMLASPLWVVVYDFVFAIFSKPEKTDDDADSGPWWF